MSINEPVEFERFAKGVSLSLRRDMDGIYTDMDTRYALLAWTARSTLAPSVVKQDLTTEATDKDCLTVGAPPCDHWFVSSSLGRGPTNDGEPAAYDVLACANMGNEIVKLWRHPPPQPVSNSYTLPEGAATAIRQYNLGAGGWVDFTEDSHAPWEHFVSRAGCETRTLYAAPPADAPAGMRTALNLRMQTLHNAIYEYGVPDGHPMHQMVHAALAATTVSECEYASAVSEAVRAHIDDLNAQVSALRERCDAAIARAEAAEGRKPASITWNDDVAEILGRMCFECIHLAAALRAGGRKIPIGAEHEQAAVIHWLLGHYLADGSNWRERARADLIDMRAHAALAKEGGNEAR